MKKYLAIAALMAVTSVGADELKFGDLNFFIKQGRFNLLANGDATTERATTGTSTIEKENFLIGSQLTYGISDKLDLLVGVDYSIGSSISNGSGISGGVVTGPDRYSEDGLGNPRIGINYRLMDQSSDMYNVDFGVISSFRFEDAERGSLGGTDGNAAAPRSNIEFNAKMGRKWNEANEWQLAAGVLYNMDGEQTTLASVGSDTKTDIDASQDFFVRASYQWRPINEFMVALSLQGTRVGEFDTQNQGTAGKSTFEDHIDFNGTFTAKYLITENFIAKFRYGMSRNPDYDIDNTEVRKRRNNFFGLGVDWLF
ncbi:MAG TPA: hypothetical protein VNJ01_10220 [Bacteriovoracaceae bacterium]|nr:hypothetical protein [Bacteriovoracaceae bacterium]